MNLDGIKSSEGWVNTNVILTSHSEWRVGKHHKRKEKVLQHDRNPVKQECECFATGPQQMYATHSMALAIITSAGVVYKVFSCL